MPILQPVVRVEPSFLDLVFADRPFLYFQIAASSLCTLLVLWRLFIAVFKKYDIKPNVYISEKEHVLHKSKSNWTFPLVSLFLVCIPHAVTSFIPHVIEKYITITPNYIIHSIYIVINIAFVTFVPHLYYNITTKRIWFTDRRIICFKMIGANKIVEYNDVYYSKAIYDYSFYAGFTIDCDRIKITTNQRTKVSQFAVADLDAVIEATKEHIDWDIFPKPNFEQTRLSKWFVKIYNKIAAKADK